MIVVVGEIELASEVKLPAMNRDRGRARELGAATLAGLSVGRRLPGDPQAFARGRHGLRWHGSAMTLAWRQPLQARRW